jgi:hypothetical protein
MLVHHFVNYVWKHNTKLTTWTMIFAELPNLLVIADLSDTWRVERLFNFRLLT